MKEDLKFQIRPTPKGNGPRDFSKTREGLQRLYNLYRPGNLLLYDFNTSQTSKRNYTGGDLQVTELF